MKQETISVFILGARGAGKTSFLTGLSVLSQPNQKSKFQMLPKDDRTAKLITDMRKRVHLGEWPTGTITTTPLHLELAHEKTTFQLSVLDYPGEDLLSAMETMELQEKENICQHLISADCILLLLDPTQDLDTELNNADKSMTERRQTALAVAINYSLAERLEKDGKLEKPRIYPILTKSDLFGQEADLGEITRRNENLLERLREYARDPRRIKMFRISACGNAVDEGEAFPENPTPYGFGKLFEQIAKDCRPKWPVIVSWSLLALLVLMSVFGFVRHTLEKGRIADTIKTGSVEEVAEIKNPLHILLDERVEKEMITFERALANPNATLDQLKEERDEVVAWGDLRDHKYTNELNQLLDRFNSRVSDGLFSKAKSDYRSGDHKAARMTCREYIDTFPTGPHKDDIEAMLDKINDREQQKYLSPIRYVKATSGPLAQSKIEKIEEYRQRFPELGGRDVDAVDRAINTAQMLIHSNKVTLVFSGVQFGGNKRDFSLIFYKDPPGRRIKDGTTLYKSKNERTEATFTKKIRIDHSEWANFEVSLWDLNFWNELMATRRLSLYRDLFRFDGKTHIQLNGVDDWPSAGGWFVAQIQISSGRTPKSLNDAELKAYEDYIYPGNAW